MSFSALVDLTGAPAEMAVFADARLDNREELIGRLDGVGAGSSDAELILAAYVRWGEECPERLLGDFAFAVWDARRRLLLCARDPLGVRPLHYASTGSRLAVASEVGQVLAQAPVSRRLDEVAVSTYLAGCVDDPDRTFFQDVRRLPPGHRLVATPDGRRVERWWDLDPEKRTVYGRNEEYAAHFLDLFQQTVKDRLRTPAGPVGVLLSGGLDSASVTAVARRLLPAQGLVAGSFVFERLRQCDERPYIQAVTTELDLETELVEAEQHPIQACEPPLDTPFVGWDTCFREMLLRMKRRGTRVLLTGHGGDDLMTGTPLAYADRLRTGDLGAGFEVVRHALSRGRAWRWILYHYLLRPLLSIAPSSPRPPDWIHPAFARRTGLAERLAASPSRGFRETARQALYDRFRQTPWTRAIHWYDRNAAAFGIQVRHPFVDRRLLEFLFSIPPGRLFRAGLSKPLLRDTMSGLLPEAVRLRQGKAQLGAFLDLSLRESRRDRVEALLAAPMAADLGYVDGERLSAMYRQYREGEPSEAQRTLWYAITLEAWLREHGTFLGLSHASVEARPAA